VPRPLAVALATAAAAAVLAAGCGSGGGSGTAGSASDGGPRATPADFEGTVAELDRQHVAVSDVVSGDTGCSDPELVGPAIGLSASGVDQPTPVRIHLYLFRDGPTYDRLRQAVDRCAATFVGDASAYVAIDARPFVATSQGPWAPAFTAAVRAALTRASGG
jgi:hypothetical protein